MERTQRAKGSTRVSRVVFGVPPKTGEVHETVADTAAQTAGLSCASNAASFCGSRSFSSSRPQFGGTPNWTWGTRVPPGQISRAFAAASRGLGRPASRLIPIFLCVFLFAGCKGERTLPADRSTTAHALFEQTTKEFHAPSAEAKGAERDRLLNAAAKNYERLIKDFPDERDLCAQSLRALGNIHASQGKTSEALKLYAAVGEKYPDRDWEVLQAWKAAADLLWDANQRGDAKRFYAKIVERFGKNDAPQIIQTVVRGSKARLAE